MPRSARPSHPSRATVVVAVVAVVLGSLTSAIEPATAQPVRAAAAGPTTAWQHGHFVEDRAALVHASDIVLASPNYSAAQSLFLGNGALGASTWSAAGFTAQLNRDDTMPSRKSPGQLQLPGLAAMTSAPDFTARLDLYNAVLHESGGGMTLAAWVPANSDELIVDVKGADPSVAQTATLQLWSGRSPTAAASRGIGTLSETWTDSSGVGASGRTFGTLAAVTADARHVSASVASPTQVTVSFTPDAHGSFRVVTAAPYWTGGDAASTARRLLARDSHAGDAALLGEQSRWWQGFWAHTGVIQASSADGSAGYLENLRTIYLYSEAASMRGDLPASHAGIADLANFSRDQIDWDPAAYWLWNLRTQLSANMSAGNFALNRPIFELYLRNIDAIKAWTTQQMGGRPGICVPETMRFNGNGTYNGSLNNASCSEAASPSYNALTISSGPEVAMWIWQQFQDTHDLAFLHRYYPILREAAIFLRSYMQVGSDGLLHHVANAHETQWAVSDPTTDLVAMQTLFPATASAAHLLHTDAALAASLTADATKIPDYPRTDEQTKTQLLPPSADAAGTDVIADSYQPSAALKNSENIGLEPLWPWNTVSDDAGALTALEDRTYTYRPNVNQNDWSMDAVDAARLGRASDVATTLVANVEKYQHLINGMATFSSGRTNAYIEQSATVATALDEALVQDYDGLIRVAPAWPSTWDGAGTVYVQGGTKVDVQVSQGRPTTVAVEAGSTSTLHVRNPWPGHAVEVVDGRTGHRVGPASSADVLGLAAQQGRSYVLQPVTDATDRLPFAPITEAPATAARHLGPVQIGLDAVPHFSSLASSFDDAGISDDAATDAGNYDGNRASFSAQALAAAGATPGATIHSSGADFTWPVSAPGTPDNTVADGQAIDVGASGSSLAFLVSGSSGAASGTGSIVYTDGTVSSYSLSAPDWFSTTPASGEQVAVSSSYQNRPGNTTYQHSADVFSTKVDLLPGKTVASVVLPGVGPLAAGATCLHVFAMKIIP